MSVLASLIVISFLLLGAGPALAADDSKLKEATRQVERGGKKLGDAVEETAKGIGKTTIEGAKTIGEKVKEAGKAAEPQAKSAWQSARDGAISFGQSVKNFFNKMVSSD